MMINVRIHVVTVKEPWISSLSSNNEWNKSYRFYVIFMHDVWETPSNMPILWLRLPEVSSTINPKSDKIFKNLSLTFSVRFLKYLIFIYYINVNWSEIFYDLVDWMV